MYYANPDLTLFVPLPLPLCLSPSLQVEQNRELEARLEQALHRWKLEKETSTQETEKYIKMRSTCATLVEQLNQSSTDAAQLADRLG